jgi:hypothetical protein
MNIVAMTAFAAAIDKPGALQVCDQLANLPRHKQYRDDTTNRVKAVFSFHGQNDSGPPLPHRRALGRPALRPS